MAAKAQCDEDRDYLAAAGSGKQIYATGVTEGERAFDAVNAST